ncbi:hybrid sensor histidine kinase/response regulator [Paludisphaera mucosa]|uniref:histidine kinase n=1 Tax=Paludisphaera mucosa TaxID=3030827 RepID=A0ABT6FB12_9BACT|nr:PAS domain-containing protein [Paludisphaera mucosa]MDG3004778.1 PAS domain-containing protein [Paludisphaera mucosa]
MTEHPGLAPDFQALFEAVPTPSLLVRPDDRFTIVAVNASYLRATRATRESLVGRGLFEAFADDREHPGATDGRDLRASLDRVLATRAPDHMAVRRRDVPRPGGGFEERHWSPLNAPVLSAEGAVAHILHQLEDVTEVVRLRREAGERDVDASAAPIVDDDGRNAGVVVTYHDAGEGRRAEETTSRSEQRFRALVTASSDVMYRMSPDWSEMQPLDGRGLVASSDAPLRDWMQRNLPASEHALVRGAIREAVSARRMFELEHRVVRADGSIGWTYSRAVPILDAGGEVVEWFGVASDVTARKQAEEENDRLEAEAERQRRIYEAALSNTPDLVYVFGLDHRFLYANEALLQMWGRTREDALGKNCLELGYEPWHAEMHDGEIERVAATRRPIRGEVPFAGTNGRRIYDYIFVPVIGKDGRVVAVAGTTRDVTERRQAEQEIREQAERLRENDRRKDEFLAMLAHELRNPLSAIGNAVTLTTRSGLQEHIGWSMGVVTRQMRHLTRLIDDLLDVSRINRGKIELRRELVDLTSILAAAAATAKPSMEERGHTLEVATSHGGLWADVDPTRIEQVVVNLLSNAAKYSENGGLIALRARNEGDEVVVSVRDRGVGIPPETLPQMFELFAQGDRSLARSEGGLGIGLTVVKKLVEMHGGTVDARSEGRGKGSEFTIRLPRAARPVAAAPEGTAPAEGGRIPSRILVVEDNVDAAWGMAQLLKLLGHDVAVAHDGPQGIEKAKEHRPEFVLLDIGLPGMDGYEVASRLRREPSCKDAVIIAISGYGRDEDRRRSKEAGFDHHLIKPLDHDVLITLLAAPGR